MNTFSERFDKDWEQSQFFIRRSAYNLIKAYKKTLSNPSKKELERFACRLYSLAYEHGYEACEDTIQWHREQRGSLGGMVSDYVSMVRSCRGE